MTEIIQPRRRTMPRGTSQIRPQLVTVALRVRGKTKMSIVRERRSARSGPTNGKLPSLRRCAKTLWIVV